MSDNSADGHQSMKMTMRYAHLSPAFLSAEVNLLDPAARSYSGTSPPSPLCSTSPPPP
jgi:hypothetical protein